MELTSQGSSDSACLEGIAPRLCVLLARTAAEIEDAQRLRYKVFAEELGARICNAGDELDQDEFDAFCDHLIVRDLDSLRVVGTYRILAPDRARAIGRRYVDNEFDLARLRLLAPTMIEAGRACVHRDYRTGPAILLLWAGLAKYMRSGRYRHLIGCASVSLADGGYLASRVREDLQGYLVDPEYRAFPRLPWHGHRIEQSVACKIPPLINGYLRVGARVCGEPAWDADFNSADFLLWLSLDNLNPRYARHFELLAGRTNTAPVRGRARR